MAASDSFNDLKNIYTAIVDLDKALMVQDDPNILDTVLDAVKDIPKSKYPEEEKNIIIKAIRDSLKTMYAVKTSEIGEHIGLDFSGASDMTVVPEEDEEDRSEDEGYSNIVPDSVSSRGNYMGMADDYSDNYGDSQSSRDIRNSNNVSFASEDDYDDDEDDRPRSSRDIFNSMMNAGKEKVLGSKKHY